MDVTKTAHHDADECHVCGGPYGDGPGLKYDYCPACDMYWGDPDDANDKAPTLPAKEPTHD